MQNLQWYPGHMAKTRRLIEANLKLIDVVVEILDVFPFRDVIRILTIL